MEQQHRQAQQQNQQLTQVILDPKQRQRHELQCPHQVTPHTQTHHLLPQPQVIHPMAHQLTHQYPPPRQPTQLIV
jgi:hypothetical protein